MLRSLRSKSTTSARRGSCVIRSIASASSFPAPMPDLLSVARARMKGSTDFDHAPPISLEAPAIDRQASVHCARISAGLPSSLIGGSHGSIAAVVIGGAIDCIGVVERQRARVVDKQPCLLHCVLSKLLQIILSDSDGS